MTESPLHNAQQLLNAVSHLTINVKKALKGMQGGIHQSYLVGPSVEFSEHNRYAPGDSPTDIDWNAVARTDRFYIKSHEKETIVKCLLLLDCSGSMDYQGAADAHSKLAYAQIVLGAVAHILLKQGDSVGLIGYGNSHRCYVPPHNNPSHFSSLMQKMAAVKPGGKPQVSLLDALKMANDIIGERGLIVVAGDLWGVDDKTRRVLSGMAKKYHDVSVMQVICNDELTLPFNGTVHFEGMEREGSLSVQPNLLRDAYVAEVQKEQDGWQRLAARFDYAFLSTPTSDAPATAIRRFVGLKRVARR